MSLKLGDEAPNLCANSTHRQLQCQDWRGSMHERMQMSPFACQRALTFLGCVSMHIMTRSELGIAFLPSDRFHTCLHD